jgi:hypothetical protein
MAASVTNDAFVRCGQHGIANIASRDRLAPTRLSTFQADLNAALERLRGAATPRAGCCARYHIDIHISFCRIMALESLRWTWDAVVRRAQPSVAELFGVRVFELQCMLLSAIVEDQTTFDAL